MERKEKRDVDYRIVIFIGIVMVALGAIISMPTLVYIGGFFIIVSFLKRNKK